MSLSVILGSLAPMGLMGGAGRVLSSPCWWRAAMPCIFVLFNGRYVFLGAWTRQTDNILLIETL